MLEKASIIFSHPFIYDLKSLKSIGKKSKSAFKHDDSLLPYVENFFHFQSKEDNQPPFTLAVHNKQGILIRIKPYKQKEMIFKMTLSITIHFLPKNLAILVIKIDDALYNSENNINWNVSPEEQLSFLNNSFSVISEQWKNQPVKIHKIFNKNDFVTIIPNRITQENIDTQKFAVKNIKDDKIRISGFDDLLYDKQNEDIKAAMDKNKLLYEDGGDNKSIQEFILSYIKPFTKSTDQKHLNPFNRTRTFTYIVLLSSNQNNNINLIDTLLSQKKYNKESIAGIEYSPWKISNMVNIYANENSIVVFGTQDDTKYMKNNYFENYIEKYYRIYLIVLYQKNKLEELILQSSQLNFTDATLHQDDYQKKIADLKSNILYYMTKIDYTNFSSNANRNAFYRFMRNIFYINDLHIETDNVINRIDNELQKIKDERVKLETIKEDKKQEKWVKRMTILGLIIAGIEVISTILSFFNITSNNLF